MRALIDRYGKHIDIAPRKEKQTDLAWSSSAFRMGLVSDATLASPPRWKIHMSKFYVTLLAVLPLVTLVACGQPDEIDDDLNTDETPYTGDDTDDFEEVVNEAPTVLYTSPEEGAIGVFTDDTIEIRFSEPMDPATVRVGTHGNDDLPLTWNATLDAITIDADLEYSNGYGNHPELTPGRRYEFTLHAGAADQEGEYAEPLVWSFETAKRMKVELEPDLALTRTVMGNGNVHNQGGNLYVGDSGVLVDESMRALLTFDLSNLPEGAIASEATLAAEQVAVAGLPYVYLGSIYAEPVSFREITGDSYDTPATGAPESLSGNAALEVKTSDVSHIFMGALADRDGSEDRAQMMLRFAETASVNGVGDTATLDIDSVAVTLHYLAE